MHTPNNAPGCSTAQWHKVRLLLTGALVGTLITGRLHTASMFASQRLAEVSAVPFRSAPPPDASMPTFKRTLLAEIALQQNNAQQQRQAQQQHQAELRDALRTAPSLETHSLQTHKNYSLAVVMPFIDAQLPKLFKCFEHWLVAPPCDASLAAALLLYHPTSATDSNVSLAEVRGKLARSSGCFSLGIELLWANLTAAVAWSHPDGTCGQFYMLFSLLRSRFDYFYLMEPDAIAIRPNWLMFLVAEVQVAPCTSFWIKGSVSRCSSDYGDMRRQHNLHINGGALYCVPPQWDNTGPTVLLEAVQRFFPSGFELGVDYGGCAMGGFDHSIYWFLHSAVNFDYARTILHLYQYTDVLHNMCEEDYSPLNVLAENPRAVIVHSKGPLFSDLDLYIREEFWRILGRYPAKATEQAVWHARIRNGSASKQQIEQELCVSRAYEARLRSGHPSEACTRRCLAATKASPVHGGPLLSSVGYRCCKPSFERLAWQRALPPAVPYVWTVDFHTGPMACSEPLLVELGARVHSEIDFGNCVYHPHMCKERLKVLAYNKWAGFSLDPCPNTMRRAFFEAYKHDEELSRVDLFVCSHPAANCELFMPFDRPMLVYATTRIEFGRYDETVAWRQQYLDIHGGLKYAAHRWSEWVANLQRIASKPGNVIAANNMFDVHAIKYHTNITPVYLPSWCGLTGANGVGISYSPIKSKPVLLGPYRDNIGNGTLVDGLDVRAWAHPIFANLTAELHRLPATPLRIRRMREVYDEYEWEQVAEHPAIIYIPYQVSTISFFELYRANIPIFIPSCELLARWTLEHGIMWERIYGTPPRLVHSDEPDAPYTNESLHYWLSKSDFYLFPHVQLFNSWAECLQMLQSVDLRQVSRQMVAANARQRADIKAQWAAILENAMAHSGRPLAPADDFDRAWAVLWGEQVPLHADPVRKQCSVTTLPQPPQRPAAEEAHRRPFLLPGDYLGGGMLLSTRNTLALYVHSQHELCAAPMDLSLTRRNPAPFHLRLHDTHPRIGHMCMHHGMTPVSQRDPPIWCKWMCTGCTMHLSDAGDLYWTNRSGYRKLLPWGRHNNLGGRCWSPPGIEPRTWASSIMVGMQESAQERQRARLVPLPLLLAAAVLVGVALLPQLRFTRHQAAGRFGEGHHAL